MARDSDSAPTRGNGALYFIVGILVAVVAVLAYFLFGGDAPPGTERDVNVNVTTPAPAPAPEAAPAPAAEPSN